MKTLGLLAMYMELLLFSGFERGVLRGSLEGRSQCLVGRHDSSTDGCIRDSS